MNIQRSRPLTPQIQQLKDLFLISRQICRQRALELLLAHPKNLIVLQILAACQSLDERAKNYTKAIELYQKCLEIDRDSIAFYNNLAKNYIELQDFHMAVTFLNDIKQKWNHPAIYLNLAVAYQRGKVTDTRLLDDAVEKMERYRKYFPDFQADHQKGLIHTFLLEPDQNYNHKKIKEFETEVLEGVIMFQNMIQTKLEVEEMKKVLSTMEPKIARRIERENIYGISIDNPIKAIIQVFEAFRVKLIPLYKSEWKKQIDKHMIEAIGIVNSNIFEAKIDNSYNYEIIYERQVQPCLIQLEVIANDLQMEITDLEKKKDYEDKRLSAQSFLPSNEPLRQNLRQPIQESIKSLNFQSKDIFHFHPKKPFQQPVQQEQDESLKELRKKDEQIRKRQRKDKQNIFERGEIPTPEYEFKSRYTEVEQFMVKYQSFIHETLRVEGDSTSTPLFLIIHLKQHNISSYHAYYNNNRIKAQLIKAPEIPNLQNLKKHAQRNQIVKYYHVFNLLFKFYNFYGTHNFEYRLKNKISNLDIDTYANLITPVLNEFFEEDQFFGKAKFGWLFNEIHFGVSQYLHQTSQNSLKAFKLLWKRINLIQQTYQNGAQALLNDILKQKVQIYRNHLLNHQFSKLESSTKEHFYFNWKINRSHFLNTKKDIRSAFQQDQDWIISNTALFLITIAEKRLTEDKHLLVQSFTDCFYKPNHSYKEEIIKKFYTSNHIIPLVEKAVSVTKKVLKIIVPFE